jgi:hypothetical protein
MFPMISTSHMRLQAGTLYARLSAERQARSYLVDIVQFSDTSFVPDFHKRGGWMPYVSPETVAYKPEYKSKPGQTGCGEVLGYNSLRADVPPPAGGVKLSELKVLFPEDWDVFIKTHAQFVRESTTITTGMR